MIYRLTLSPIADNLVPRDGLAPRHGVRYRYNQQHKLWKIMPPQGTVRDKDRTYRDWFDIFRLKELVSPIDPQEFAFGLFLTSRSIHHEAAQTFFGANHFVFDDRFNLHMFITIIGDNAKYIQSVSMHWSSGEHDVEVQKAHKQWFPQSEYGPRLAKSVVELREACPRLEYLEMLPGQIHFHSDDAKNIVGKSHNEWTLVKALCDLDLKKFHMVTPGDGFLATLEIDTSEASWWEKEIKKYRDIEAYVNEQIHANRSRIEG